MRRKQAERKALMDLFVRWVSQNRMAPQNASTAFHCDPPPAPPPGKKPEDVAREHFCTATRAAGKYQLLVRYWEAEPDAVRFSTRPASPASCADLGEHRVVRTWDVPAPGGQMVKRTHCEFSSGPLAGMQGIVSAAIADLHVFSPKYAQREPRSTPITSHPPAPTVILRRGQAPGPPTRFATLSAGSLSLAVGGRKLLGSLRSPYAPHRAALAE